MKNLILASIVFLATVVVGLSASLREAYGRIYSTALSSQDCAATSPMRPPDQGL